MGNCLIKKLSPLLLPCEQSLFLGRSKETLLAGYLLLIVTHFLPANIQVIPVPVLFLPTRSPSVYSGCVRRSGKKGLRKGPLQCVDNLFCGLYFLGKVVFKSRMNNFSVLFQSVLFLLVLGDFRRVVDNFVWHGVNLNLLSRSVI